MNKIITSLVEILEEKGILTYETGKLESGKKLMKQMIKKF
jgi:hypothetical protein